MAESRTSIGPWLVQLFSEIFFQPDDAVSSRAFDRGISRDLDARINGQRLSFAQFRAAVEETRYQNLISEQSNVELLQSSSDTEGNGGSVAQVSQFTLKNKSTGEETTSSTVILATIEWVKEGRILTQLTEVSK